MKKAIYFIFVLAFALISNAFGQKPSIELIFTAQYQSQYVPLDSIYVENLTQGGDTILYAPDTVLVLNYSLGVTANPSSNTGFRVSQNRPNPFAEQTTISIFLPEADHLQVSVINLLGQKVAFFENSLDAGNHSFVFYPGDDKYYILTATANGLTETIKMVNLNNHSSKQVLLNYQGPDETMAGYKSTQDINDFGYSLGDLLRFTGFAKNPSDIAGSDVIEATPAGNENYVFDIIEGIPCPGTPTVTYEGQTYNTVLIGIQCWFKENLNVGTMIDSSNNQTNNSLIEKYCYGDDPANCATYGGLYQWDEMMQYTTQQGTQGICPAGWHMPTDTEWTALTNFIGGTASPHGNELKSCRQINSPLGGGCNTSEHPRWEEDINNGNYGTDDYGFSGLPGGWRISTWGTFEVVGSHGRWWSSTVYAAHAAWVLGLNHDDCNVYLNGSDMQFGFSVRCLRDYEPPVSGFYGAPTTGIVPLTVNFTDQSTKNPTSWQWDFGDGGTSTQQNPVHTYNSIGTYTVQLTVSNSYGYDTEIKTNYINVNPGSVPCPGIPTITDIDGNTYNTVLLGNQCWMKENLKTTTYSNGTAIPNVTYGWVNLTTGAYAWYENNISWKDKYGALYNWYTTVDPKYLCPTGWHVPTNDEWMALTDYIGGTGSPHGNELKSCRQVNSPLGGGCNTSEHPRWEEDANYGTDDYNFSGLPGGFRYIGGDFSSLGSNGTWWSSSEGSSGSAWALTLNYEYSGVSTGNDNKRHGYSVRCLRDSENPPASGFSGTPTTGIVPLTVNFTDQSTNSPVSWQWDFGDGGTSAQQNPVHTYNSIGTYTVQLTVSNSYGYDTKIKTNYINVNPGSVPCPGNHTITDIDGNTYNTLLIGDQCWMKENLKTTTYRNGTVVPNITDANAWSNLTSGAYVWYNNDIGWKDSYGALYNWYATVDTNSLCPTGWHVPTHDEWTALTDFIGGPDSPHGNELKSCRQVNSPLVGDCNTSEHPRWEEDASNGNYGTDDYGFSGLPGGNRYSNGYFHLIGYKGYWWSSTENYSNYAWDRGLGYDDGYVDEDYDDRGSGFSVRCLRD